MNEEKTIHFSVLKQKIIKTDEVIKMYLELNNKLKKVQHAYKEMKQRHDDTSINFSRIQLEYERCSFSLENFKQRIDVLDTENKELQKQNTRLEEQYNQQIIQSQLSIKCYEDELKALNQINCKADKLSLRKKRAVNLSRDKIESEVNGDNNGDSKTTMNKKSPFKTNKRKCRVEDNFLNEATDEPEIEENFGFSNSEDTGDNIIILKQQPVTENLEKTTQDFGVQTDAFETEKKTAHIQTVETLKTFRLHDLIFDENKQLKHKILECEAEIIKLKAKDKPMKKSCFTQTEEPEVDDKVVKEILLEMSIPCILSPMSPIANVDCSSDTNGSTIPEILVTPPTPQIEKNVQQAVNFDQEIKENIANRSINHSDSSEEFFTENITRFSKRTKYRSPGITNDYIKLKRSSLRKLLNKKYVLNKEIRKIRKLRRQDYLLQTLRALNYSKINFTISNSTNLSDLMNTNTSRDRCTKKVTASVKKREKSYITEQLDCMWKKCNHSNMLLSNVRGESQLLGFYNVKDELPTPTSSRMENITESKLFPSEKFVSSSLSSNNLTPENILETLADIIVKKLDGREKIIPNRKKNSPSQFDTFASETETEIERLFGEFDDDILQRNKMLLETAKQQNQTSSLSKTPEKLEAENKSGQELKGSPIASDIILKDNLEWLQRNMEATLSNNLQVSNKNDSFKEHIETTYSKLEKNISFDEGKTFTDSFNGTNNLPELKTNNTVINSNLKDQIQYNCDKPSFTQNMNDTVIKFPESIEENDNSVNSKVQKQKIEVKSPVNTSLEKSHKEGTQNTDVALISIMSEPNIENITASAITEHPGISENINEGFEKSIDEFILPVCQKLLSPIKSMENLYRKKETNPLVHKGKQLFEEGTTFDQKYGNCSDASLERIIRLSPLFTNVTIEDPLKTDGITVDIQKEFEKIYPLPLCEADTDLNEVNSKNETSNFEELSSSQLTATIRENLLTPKILEANFAAIHSEIVPDDSNSICLTEFIKTQETAVAASSSDGPLQKCFVDHENKVENVPSCPQSPLSENVNEEIKSPVHIPLEKLDGQEENQGNAISESIVENLTVSPRRSNRIFKKDRCLEVSKIVNKYLVDLQGGRKKELEVPTCHKISEEKAKNSSIEHERNELWNSSVENSENGEVVPTSPASPLPENINEVKSPVNIPLEKLESRDEIQNTNLDLSEWNIHNLSHSPRRSKRIPKKKRCSNSSPYISDEQSVSYLNKTANESPRSSCENHLVSDTFPSESSLPNERDLLQQLDKTEESELQNGNISQSHVSKQQGTTSKTRKPVSKLKSNVLRQMRQKRQMFRSNTQPTILKTVNDTVLIENKPPNNDNKIHIVQNIVIKSSSDQVVDLIKENDNDNVENYSPDETNYKEVPLPRLAAREEQLLTLPKICGDNFAMFTSEIVLENYSVPSKRFAKTQDTSRADLPEEDLQANLPNNLQKHIVRNETEFEDVLSCPQSPLPEKASVEVKPPVDIPLDKLEKQEESRESTMPESNVENLTVSPRRSKRILKKNGSPEFLGNVNDHFIETQNIKELTFEGEEKSLEHEQNEICNSLVEENPGFTSFSPSSSSSFITGMEYSDDLLNNAEKNEVIPSCPESPLLENTNVEAKSPVTFPLKKLNSRQETDIDLSGSNIHLKSHSPRRSKRISKKKSSNSSSYVDNEKSVCESPQNSVENQFLSTSRLPSESSSVNDSELQHHLDKVNESELQNENISSSVLKQQGTTSKTRKPISKLKSNVLSQMRQKRQMFRSNMQPTILKTVREKSTNNNSKIRTVQDILTTVQSTSSSRLDLRKLNENDNVETVENCDNRLGNIESSSQNISTTVSTPCSKKSKTTNDSTDNNVPFKKKRKVQKKVGCDVLSTIIHEMDKDRPKAAAKRDSRPRSIKETVPDNTNEKYWRKGVLVVAENIYNTGSKPKQPVERKLSNQNVYNPKSVITEKSRILLNRLLKISTEENIPDEIILEFKRQDVDSIAELILQLVSEDIHDKPDDKYYPAPLMTKTQRILLGLMVRLEKEHIEDVMDTFLSRAQVFLFKIGCAVRPVISITRLYMAVCKLRSDIDRMREFCSNAFLSMGDLAVPLYFTVLTSWTEVLPMESNAKSYPLAKALVQVVHLKIFNRPGYNLSPLRLLLSQFYGYPKERWNTDEIFDELYQQYLRNPDKSFEIAMRLLCKNMDSKWIYKKLNEFFKPLVYKIPLENVNFKALVIIFIGNICRCFKPKNEFDETCINELRRWFVGLTEDEAVPDLINRAVDLSLVMLPKKKKNKVKKTNKKKNTQKIMKPKKKINRNWKCKNKSAATVN